MSKKVISATRTKGAATLSSAARTKGKSHLPSYDKYIKNQSGSAEEEALLDVISALTSQSQPVSASSLQNSQENDWKNFTTLHGLVTCLIQLQSKHPSRESNTSSSSTSAAAAAPSSSLAHLEPNTEKRFAEFKSWLEENEFPAHPLEFVHVGGVEGNGAVAKRDLAEGELFLKVPHKFLITTETAEAASYMSSLLNSDFVTGGLLSRVKNVLLSVHLACELKRGASSFWSPYIDILPRTFTLPLFFSLEEISLLKGSPAFQEVINLFTTLVKQYIFLRKVLLLQAAILDHLKFDEQQEPEDEDEDEGHTRFPILLKDFTFELFRWAASIVMTRQNKIIVGGTNESPEYGFALIPVWDMCNHGVDTTSTIYDTATETIECVAKKPVSAGQPVLLFYGPRSNLDFFVYSGFVFQDNPYDHYRLTLGVSKLDALYNEKMKIISAVGMKDITIFELYKTLEESQKLLFFLRVFALDAKEAEKLLVEVNKVNQKSFESISKFFEYVISSPNPISEENEKKSLSFLQTRCKLLLLQYHKNLTPTETVSPVHFSLIKSLIEEEKKILLSAGSTGL